MNNLIMTHNPQGNNNVEKSFESDLFFSLKSYGYLFPENTKEVERFEDLYGNTEIDVPMEFEPVLPDNVLISNADFTKGLGVAAFSTMNNNSFKKPDEK